MNKGKSCEERLVRYGQCSVMVVLSCDCTWSVTAHGLSLYRMHHLDRWWAGHAHTTRMSCTWRHDPKERCSRCTRRVVSVQEYAEVYWKYD